MKSGIQMNLTGEMAQNADGVKAAAQAMARGVNAWKINVSTRRGAETLTGEVDSPAENQPDGKIAEELDGVKEDVNKLEVRG
jgi:osmotically-inducible protein OsmY